MENEIYLRPLTPHEAVAQMAGTLMEDLAAKKRADDFMTVADMLLAPGVACIYGSIAGGEGRSRRPKPGLLTS